LLNSSKIYSISNAYDFLVSIDNNGTEANKNVWLKAVSLKVNLFVWRLLLNHISTKDNLFRRGVVPLDECNCIGGCGMVEDNNHLFVRCSCLVYFGIWWLVGWVSICGSWLYSGSTKSVVCLRWSL